MSDELHTAAWEIRWPGRRVVHTHNTVADYKHEYPDAISRELAYKDDAERQIRELQARVAELERDAGRYRWLRDLPLGDENEYIGNMPGDSWDELIDDAMLSKRGERG